MYEKSNLTSKETAQLKVIDNEYFPRLKELDKSIDAFGKEVTYFSKIIFDSQRSLTPEELKEYKEANNQWFIYKEEYDNLKDEWEKARYQITDKASRHTIMSYLTDVPTAINTINSGIPLLIRLLFFFAEEEPTEEEKADTRERLRKRGELLEDSIRVKYKELEENPHSTDILNEIWELEKNYKRENLYGLATAEELFYDDILLKEYFNRTYYDYLEMLEQASPNSYKEAIAFIDDCINNKYNFIS